MNNGTADIYHETTEELGTEEDGENISRKDQKLLDK
jgi:hypothetical protein